MKTFKRWIILFADDIYRNEVYYNKKEAKEVAGEYLGSDYKIIEVKINEKIK